MSPNIQRRIFFVSTGRAGTKKLAELYRGITDSDIVVEHQTSWSRWMNALANMRYGGLCSQSSLDFLMKCFIESRRSCGCYVNTDSLLSFALSSRVAEEYDLQVIHIVRDPLAFAASMINWQFSRTKSLIAHGMIPFWQPGLWPFEHAVRCYKKEYLLNKYLSVWLIKNRRLFDEFSQLSTYRIICFEKLFSANYGRNSLIRLATWTGEPMLSEAADILLRKENYSLSRKLRVEEWESFDSSVYRNAKSLYRSLLEVADTKS